MKLYAINIQQEIEEELFNTLLNFVDPLKQSRIKKFRFWQDAHNCLFSELLVRKIACKKCNILNKDLILSINEFGKPFISNSNGFEFNISHSGQWVLVGVDVDRPIGVDIEKIVHIDLNIAKNYFSQQEYFDLMNSQNRLDYFFTLWSLKESFIKYIGKGLSYPLDEFSMILSEERIKVEIRNKVDTEIYFKSSILDEEYKIAISSSNPHCHDEIKQIEIEDFISSMLILK